MVRQFEQMRKMMQNFMGGGKRGLPKCLPAIPLAALEVCRRCLGMGSGKTMTDKAKEKGDQKRRQKERQKRRKIIALFFRDYCGIMALVVCQAAPAFSLLSFLRREFIIYLKMNWRTKWQLNWKLTRLGSARSILFTGLLPQRDETRRDGRPL